MNTYEEINQEINLILNEFYNQDKLKQEYRILKDKHKRVIRLIEAIDSCRDFKISKEDRLKLYSLREHYRGRRNFIADMIEDEAWLYFNLT